MQPHQFIERWRNTTFGERQAAQSFFNDLCALVDHPTPAAYGNPDAFTFEKWVPGGFADAYYRGAFRLGVQDRLECGAGLWHEPTCSATQVHLKTPPLLIVSSFKHHTDTD